MGLNDSISCISIILLITVQGIIAKSCHYDNLFAKPVWTTVKSPGYPRRFPAQTQCWWKITSPPQYRIQLEFTDFTLVPPNNRKQCVWQWLNVIEGGGDPDDGEPPMLTMCGTKRPKIIVSSGNVLQINLHSNSAAANSRYKGFEARYKYTTEDPFVPTDVGMFLPDTVPSPSNQAPSRISNGGGSRSLGSVLDSIAKPRPRPLPPNPNPVLTLQNRRTEAQNRARNNGITNNNAMRNNMNPGFNRGPSMPQVPVRPMTKRPLDNQNTNKQVAPAPRGRPLRYEIKILIAVLGTVGGIVLVAFLMKKFVFDRLHKKKAGGNVPHAYAHFRHFKKNRKNVDGGTGSKVNTISASVASAKATQSQNSELSVSNRSSSEVRKVQKSSEENFEKIEASSLNSGKEKPSRRRETEKEMVYPKVRGAQEVHNSASRLKTDTRNNAAIRNDGYANEDPPEYREIYNGDRERRKRKRTRRSRDNHLRYERETNYAHQQRRTTNRRMNSGGRENKKYSNRYSRQSGDTTPSDYSSDENRRGGSWRDRAYS